jgi:hypothetical protein
MTENAAEFNMELKMKGTFIFADTFTPTAKQLHYCLHVVLNSPHEWNPQQVTFSNQSQSFKDEIEQHYNISTIKSTRNDEINIDPSTVIFDIASINNKIINSVNIKHNDTIIQSDRVVSSLERKKPAINDELSKRTLDIGDADVSRPNVFMSTNRHTDVSAEDLSERWCISYKTAKETLKKTTQKFIRSALLPLSRRYRADRMFHKKSLSGAWSCDTLDGRTMSLDGNRYAQVFANKSYFAKIYHMDSKGKVGDALRVFCREFGVPESLTFDGSMEQCGKNTEFIQHICKNDIKFHVTEPDLY